MLKIHRAIYLQFVFQDLKNYTDYAEIPKPHKKLYVLNMTH